MNSAGHKLQTRKELPVLWRIAIFGLLLFVILSSLAHLFDHAAKKDLREKARWMIDKQNEAYDFAILGSSRSYMGVDIFTIEKLLGQKGINLSLEGATYPEEYLALKLFLSRNRINHLILDLNLIDFDHSDLNTPFHAYHYLPDIANKDVFDTLNDNFGMRAYLWKYVPFFKNAEFNTKLGYLQFYIWAKMQRGNKVFKAEFDEKGSRILPGGKLPNFEEESSDDWRRTASASWNPLRQKYFLKILKLAKERGITVTLVAMPEYNPGKKRWQSHDEIIAFYEAIVRSNQLSILRFDQDGMFSDKSFFLDKAHLNRKGALIFSEKLAVRLQKQSNEHNTSSGGNVTSPYKN